MWHNVEVMFVDIAFCQDWPCFYLQTKGNTNTEQHWGCTTDANLVSEAAAESK